MMETAFDSLLNRKHRRDDEITTVEYAIMCVLIGIAVAGFGQGLSDTVTGVYGDFVTTLKAAAS